VGKWWERRGGICIRVVMSKGDRARCLQQASCRVRDSCEGNFAWRLRKHLNANFTRTNIDLTKGANES
jgi:hypothetical protein